MNRSRRRYNEEEVRRLGETTIAYYDRFARAFWDGTRHHDVSQNYAAFLDAIEGAPPYSILDLGCGPGRDLSHFRSLGHEAVGLDGSPQFVAMARAHSRCEVLHQDFLSMRLPESRFDGIFANASLFHVPSQELLSDPKEGGGRGAGGERDAFGRVEIWWRRLNIIFIPER